MKKQDQRMLSIIFGLALLIFAVGIFTKTILEAFDNSTSGNIELSVTLDPLKVELANEISRYENGLIDFIDLAVITTFSWDCLFMFGDYTQPSEIDRAVGRSWRESCYTQINVSDGYTLLLFVEDGVVVHCLDYPKDEGHFLVSEQRYRDGISSQEALFVVNEQGRIIWVGNR